MTDSYSPAPAPQVVDSPVMAHAWEHLTFLHWSYPVDEVQRLLPPGLSVHTFRDKAWVGLVPFQMVVHPPLIPPIPWVCRFPETNVRTYVVDETGRVGIWFFSLDADRLGAAGAARAAYKLPYYWAEMTVTPIANQVTYSSVRRWPAPAGAHLDLRVRVSDRYEPTELTDLDHFLTARWTLFSGDARRLHQVEAYHQPWPLHHGEVLHLDEDLVAASGLSAPTTQPLVHFSPSVEVLIGKRRKAGVF